MTRQRLLTLALAAFSSRAAVADDQQKPTVQVEKLVFPAVGDDDQKKLTRAVEEGITAANARRGSEYNHRYAVGRSVELFTDECLADARCWQQAVELLNVPMTLSGTLTRVAEGWNADLSLYARDLARVAKHRQFECPGCSVETFGDRVRDTVLDMVRWNIQMPRGTLIVHTVPAGLAVRVDGRVVGNSPIEIVETAEQHTVVATAPDREDQRASIQVDAQGRIEVEMKAPRKAAVAPLLPPPPPETWTPRNLRIAGFTLVGVGVAGIIIGAALVGIDGQEIGRHANQNGVLVAERYTTAAPGGGIIAVGAVIGLVSVVPFYFAHRKESAARLRASVTPGGAAVSIDGRF
jgi:hypothetical protein